jgi:ferredoxin
MLHRFKQLDDVQAQRAFAIDPEYCLHGRDRFTSCSICVDACPVGAIQVIPSVVLDERQCIGCGLCVHVCPIGAIGGDTGANNVITCAARIEDARTLALACPLSAEPQHVPADIDAVICTGHCLAALGPSVYVGLLALGFERIVIRLDACKDCAFSSAHEAINQNIFKAQRVLQAWDAADRLAAVESSSAGDVERPVYDSASLPLSRRQLLRMFMPRKASAAVIDALTPDDCPRSMPSRLPAERRRLLVALGLLLPPHPQALCPAPLAGQTFGQVRVVGACTACGVCVRACPTGALKLIRDDEHDRFELEFLSAACTGCSLCLDMCPEALGRGGVPFIVELLEQQWITIASGELARCQRCGTRLAVDALHDGLCPVCVFRRENPFGSRMPCDL